MQLKNTKLITNITNGAQLHRLTFWNRHSTEKRVDFSEVAVDLKAEPNPVDTKLSAFSDGQSHSVLVAMVVVVQLF